MVSSGGGVRTDLWGYFLLTLGHVGELLELCQDKVGLIECFGVLKLLSNVKMSPRREKPMR